MTRASIAVIGVGADGLDGLPTGVRERIEGADVLLGGERHLGLVPQRPAQERHCWPRPLSGLASLLAEVARPGRDVVALASGDPLVSGIATRLIDVLGPGGVDVVPTVSSLALARARMGWSAESSETVTLVGRDPDALRRHLADGQRLLVLSSDEHTPATVADLLADNGYGASRLVVLGDLGGPTESRTEATAAAGFASPLPRLQVLAVEVVGDDGPATSWAPGLPDEAFEHDGQVTRRDVRASALARLAPRPGHLLWDVGAGAGSIGIEWLRCHPRTRAIAVEARPEAVDRITRNAARLGVPRLEVVTGRAPDALAVLPAPDAVFVGGGAGAPGLLEHCRSVLRPGGRLVVHGVTLETEALLVAARAAHGGDLTRHSFEHAEPLGGRFTGWTPARAIVSWTWEAPR